jgi:hypothetical protein
MSPLLIAVFVAAISLTTVVLFGPSGMAGIIALTFCRSALLQLIIFAAEAGAVAVTSAPSAATPIIDFVMSVLSSLCGDAGY